MNNKKSGNNLLKTNVMIAVILVIGFTLTAIISYRANYTSSLKSIEEVSALSTEGIYYQLTTMLAKPVNISLTMSHDSLLMEHLSDEGKRLNDDAYVETTKTYLDNYKEKYGFDSVFLVSTATGRYYNFNGIDRVLTEGNPENVWYYQFMDSDREYSLVIDNDEVNGADNKITVFVNCKIANPEGEVIGVVGVGIRIDSLTQMLREYEEKYNLTASLISENGIIEISTTYNGYEKTDWFMVNGQEAIRKEVLAWRDHMSNLEFWSTSSLPGHEENYVVTRYIPDLSWSLMVEQDASQNFKEIRIQLYQSGFVLFTVILIVLIVITTVIKNFNKQITELIEERETIFKRATEQLYDNIYEFNITANSCVGKRTEEYFESFGAKGLPFDQALHVIAEKQIKAEFREDYIAMFSPEHVIREYEVGNNHLKYEFMITQDGADYYWMRIDAYSFYSEEDHSIHMFVYRKNIDAEKQKELRAEIDEMTGFFTRRATERYINSQLLKQPDGMYAFFIFDIDNFKQANDLFGHVFGDFCIREFTKKIKQYFGEEEILGRIGGDEFAVLISVPDMEWVRAKAGELSDSLEFVCADKEASWKLSASIGIALFPKDGTTFDMLYENADTALYQVKRGGKTGFAFFDE